jgi:hypothetical protein
MGVSHSPTGAAFMAAVAANDVLLQGVSAIYIITAHIQGILRLTG